MLGAWLSLASSRPSAAVDGQSCKGWRVSSSIGSRATAVSLMREVHPLLGHDSVAFAAELLQQAIAAAESVKMFEDHKN